MVFLICLSATYSDSTEETYLAIGLYFVTGVDILMNLIEMGILWISLCCCKNVKIHPTAIVKEGEDVIKVEDIEDIEQNE